MKSQVLIILLMLAFLLIGCAGNSAVDATMTSPAASTETPVAEYPDVEDTESFLTALEVSGTTVERGESISQPFFSPEGSIIKLNGADVQVFEYENAEAMEKEASQVAPDGGSIGTSMVTWMDTPHFYKAGRLIVLYVGGDQTILSLLENRLGPQFAGG
jgi:hypothetical protein